MGQDSARSAFTKRRFASFARRPGLAASGECRSKILSTISTKQNRRDIAAGAKEAQIHSNSLESRRTCARNPAGGAQAASLQVSAACRDREYARPLVPVCEDVAGTAAGNNRLA